MLYFTYILVFYISFFSFSTAQFCFHTTQLFRNIPIIFHVKIIKKNVFISLYPVIIYHKCWGQSFACCISCEKKAISDWRNREETRISHMDSVLIQQIPSAWRYSQAMIKKGENPLKKRLPVMFCGHACIELIYVWHHSPKSPYHTIPTRP